MLKTNSDVKHDGIFLTMEGSVNLQLSSKNVGIFEAFYNSVKVSMFAYSNELNKLYKTVYYSSHTVLQSFYRRNFFSSKLCNLR